MSDAQEDGAIRERLARRAAVLREHLAEGNGSAILRDGEVHDWKDEADASMQLEVANATDERDMAELRSALERSPQA